MEAARCACENPIITMHSQIEVVRCEQEERQFLVVEVLFKAVGIELVFSFDLREAIQTGFFCCGANRVDAVECIFDCPCLTLEVLVEEEHGLICDGRHLYYVRSSHEVGCILRPYAWCFEVFYWCAI